MSVLILEVGSDSSRAILLLISISGGLSRMHERPNTKHHLELETASLGIAVTLDTATRDSNLSTKEIHEFPCLCHKHSPSSSCISSIQMISPTSTLPLSQRRDQKYPPNSSAHHSRTANSQTHHTCSKTNLLSSSEKIFTPCSKDRINTPKLRSLNFLSYRYFIPRAERRYLAQHIEVIAKFGGQEVHVVFSEPVATGFVRCRLLDINPIEAGGGKYVLGLGGGVFGVGFFFG